MHLILFPVFLLFLIKTLCVCEKYTICVGPDHEKSCQLLNDRNGNLDCVIENGINCLLKLQNGKASFAKLQPEEAVLGSALARNISVLGYINQSEDKDSSLEIIVITNKKKITSFSGLKYCHPGLHTTNVSPLLLNQFEDLVLKNAMKLQKDNGCDNENVTLNEIHLNRLNSTFGDSCRPGRWSSSESNDKLLKAKYPKLNAICDKSYTEGKNPFRQTLDCVNSGIGDVAVTTLDELSNYRKTSADNGHIYFLCNNFTVQAVDKPCVWARQPSPLLVANKEIARDITNLLLKSLPDRVKIINNYEIDDSIQKLLPNENEILKQFMFSDNSFQLYLINGNVSLKDYITQFRKIPEKSNTCVNRDFTVCTTSEEEQIKCEFMRQVGLNYGIRPAIHCYLLRIKEEDDVRDKYECINKILNGEANVTVLDNDQLFTALKAQLTPILQSVEPAEHRTRSAIVINDTSIQSLADLKNKSGCFSSFGDSAWYSFANLLFGDKHHTKYDVKLNSFVNETCMPGVKDKVRTGDIYSLDDQDRLCALCVGGVDSPTTVNCNSNSTENLRSFSEGSLKCLTETYRNASYAVITIQDGLPSVEDFKILCKNGTIIEGKYLDDNCYLSIKPLNVVVTSKKGKEKADIIEALMEFGTYKSSSGYTTFPLIIFGEFNGTKNLIFNDAVEGLMHFEGLVEIEIEDNDPDLAIPPSSNTFVIVLVVVILIIVIVFVIWWFYKDRIKKCRRNTPQTEDSEENVEMNTHAKDTDSDNNEEIQT